MLVPPNRKMIWNGNRAMFQEIKRVIGENWPEYKESKKKGGFKR